MAFEPGVLGVTLRPGDVVRRKPGTARDRREDRGVVTWVEGQGGLPPTFALPPVKNEAVIRLSAGVHVHTTYHNDWESMPVEEWTTEERVWSAAVGYEPPPWDHLADNDTYTWHLWVATLPRRWVDRIFGDGDWPTDFQELAVAVAQCADFDRAATAATFS